MQKIIEFCSENRDLISLILSLTLFILTIVFNSLKNKNLIKSDGLNINNLISVLVPGFINNAEAKFPEAGSGSKKKAYVVKLVSDYLSVVLKKDVGTILLDYYDRISVVIENYLNTPSVHKEVNE